MRLGKLNFRKSNAHEIDPGLPMPVDQPLVAIMDEDGGGPGRFVRASPAPIFVAEGTETRSELLPIYR
jgi:hypothetical protein